MIRSAVEDDLDGVLAVLSAILCASSTSREGLQVAMRRGEVLVAVDGGSVIGFGKVAYHPGFDLEIPLAEIESLYVLSECQGKRIGSQILEGLEGLARSKGYREFHVHAQSPNPDKFEDLIHFYERAGYCILQRRAGKWADMSKRSQK